MTNQYNTEPPKRPALSVKLESLYCSNPDCEYCNDLRNSLEMLRNGERVLPPKIRPLIQQSRRH